MARQKRSIQRSTIAVKQHAAKKKESEFRADVAAARQRCDARIMSAKNGRIRAHVGERKREERRRANNMREVLVLSNREKSVYTPIRSSCPGAKGNAIPLGPRNEVVLKFDSTPSRGVYFAKLKKGMEC